jgi:metaxin
MELDSWSEDWGIPSIDPECLKILAFAKFSGAPVRQNPCDNPFWTPNGDLPVFRHNGAILTDFPSVARHLRSCNYSADYNLSSRQVAEVTAFIQLMDDKLGPALKYLYWVDTKNHIEMTRPWFGKHLPFPLGLYYPNKFEQEVIKLIESVHGHFGEDGEIGNDTVVETSVYKGAEECLTMLSNRLGENLYMFGRSPSSLDAVMYGYLAPLLKAPFPNNALQNYLKNCGNLVKFVVRISQNYFPKVVSAYDSKQSEKGSSRTGTSEEEKKPTEEKKQESEEWPNQRRNKLIAGVVATTAMAGYAYASGLTDVIRNIELRVADDDEEEEEGEDDEYYEEES